MHIPRKRFGQNFLEDPQIIDACISAVYPAPSDLLVEIGPGLGALTKPLLRILNHLHVVEIDRDIINRLSKEYSQEKLTIHEGDVLNFDFASLGDRFRVVGNLPYNISTPFLFHLAKYGSRMIDGHFMLQKEVVERMVAAPSTSDYGRLSVMLQYQFDMEYLFTVPAEAFRPPPKVESAFVRMIPLDPVPFPARDYPLFASVVAAAFGARRKTLRNALRNLLTDDDFGRLGILPSQRAENLSISDFILIANYLADH